MTKKTIFLLLLFLMVLGTVNVNAQVRIGGSTPPHESAILDLNFDSGTDTLGLLLPRVHLIDVSSPAPLRSHKDGLVVYNLTTGGGDDDLKVGIYYNDGAKWCPVLSSVPTGGLELPIIFMRQPGKVWLGDTGNLIDTMYVALIEKTTTTTFQWYRRDPGVSPVLLNGETSDTLFIDSNKFALLGLTVPGKVSEFFCVVRNGSQTAVSSSGYAVYGPGAWLANGKWINIAPANLGANQEMTVEEQIAYKPTGSPPTNNVAYDPTVYGDWYQWGRKKDGHQTRNTNDTYGSHLNSAAGIGCHTDSLDSNGQIQNSLNGIHGKFILRNSGTGDWRQYPETDENSAASPADTWTWKDSANDPCKDVTSSLPDGPAWRVPSHSEWAQLYQNNTWVWHNGGIDGSTYGYEIKPGGAAKPTALFLPATGQRIRSGGTAYVGSSAYYWTSTNTVSSSYCVNFNSSSFTATNPASRSYGLTVRCVSEY